MTTPPPPYQDAPAAPVGSSYVVPPAPAKGRRLAIRIILGVILVAVAGWYVAFGQTHGANGAKVGDCVQNLGTNDKADMVVVNCSTPDVYKVLAVVPGVTNSYNVCDNVPGTVEEYDQIHNDGSADAPNVVLCLAFNS